MCPLCDAPEVYVLLSRVTDPRHIALIGMPPADILEDVCSAWEKAGLDVVECLRRATQVTNEWVYTATDGDLRSRFMPRRVKETTVPVVASLVSEIVCVRLFRAFAMSHCGIFQVHKELWEIIRPQDEALTVIRRLLDWIGEVDLASQRGAPRPAFKAPDGGDIFPPAEEQWWLTTFQKKKPPQELVGDEDGPVSEAEDQDKQVTDDEDPTSEEDAEEDNAFRAAPAEWTKTPIYFEKQGCDARCGMHALNNAVGDAWQTPEDMDRACDEYLRASQQEGSPEEPGTHVASTGWYSSEVMACAVTATSLRKAGRVEFVMKLEPLHVCPERLHSAIGAVVNVGGSHWVALRSIGGQVWRLDSQAGAPQPLSAGEYKSFASKHPYFAIEKAMDMTG